MMILWKYVYLLLAFNWVALSDNDLISSLSPLAMSDLNAITNAQQEFLSSTNSQPLDVPETNSVNELLAQALQEEEQSVNETKLLASTPIASTVSFPQDTLFPCEKNYAAADCPKGFMFLVDACVATREYTGPCTNDRFIPTTSETTKKMFERKCNVSWPCVECVRDYSSPCPKGWGVKNAQEPICEPPEEYEGPCKNAEISFYGTNTTVLEAFSSECNAWWKCAENFQFGRQFDNPISKEATLYRLTYDGM